MATPTPDVVHVNWCTKQASSTSDFPFPKCTFGQKKIVHHKFQCSWFVCTHKYITTPMCWHAQMHNHTQKDYMQAHMARDSIDIYMYRNTEAIEWHTIDQGRSQDFSHGVLAHKILSTQRIHVVKRCVFSWRRRSRTDSFAWQRNLEISVQCFGQCYNSFNVINSFFHFRAESEF